MFLTTSFTSSLFSGDYGTQDYQLHTFPPEKNLAAITTFSVTRAHLWHSGYREMVPQAVLSRLKKIPGTSSPLLCFSVFTAVRKLKCHFQIYHKLFVGGKKKNIRRRDEERNGSVEFLMRFSKPVFQHWHGQRRDRMRYSRHTAPPATGQGLRAVSAPSSYEG